MKQPTNCDKCDITINDDERHVCIFRNVEQTEFYLHAHERRYVTEVFKSEQILTLCSICGYAINAKTISKIIKASTTDNLIKQQSN